MPDTVTIPSTLSGHAAEIYRSAFLSAYDGTCKDSGSRRDECAARVAWAAVKNSYRKGEGGNWVAKAEGLKPWQKGQAGNQPAEGDQTSQKQQQGQTEAPDRMSGEWHAAFSDALLGECVKSDDPVRCAVQAADAAVTGNQPQDQQPQENQQQPAAPKPEEPMQKSTSVTRLIHRNDYGDLSLPLVLRKDYSPEKRAEFARKGWALPDGAYPIADMEDLMDAIHSFGRAPESRRAQVKAHIRKRARQLGALDRIGPEWGGKEEKSLSAQVRDAEEDLDQELLDQGMANRIAARPPNVNSNDWKARPLASRTVAALIQERSLARSYEEAVERSLEGGWQAIKNPTRPEEYIFQRWIDSMDGLLLQRAVLVRKTGTTDWAMRELTRGAALSLAVQIPADERRFGDPRF